jgi:hypothetical protein
MRYITPIVMELGARAKRAAGQVPLACVSGPTAGAWESCGSGGSATWGCITGGAAGHTSCIPGSAASVDGDCVSGTGVRYYCESGSGGSNDPYGCVAGPSVTP